MVIIRGPTTLSIMTFSIMTISIMTISIMPLSEMTISIVTIRRMKSTLMTFSITLNKNYTQYYNNKDYCTLMHTVLVLFITSLFKAECRKQPFMLSVTLLNVIMLNVLMLNVVAPL